MTKRSFAMALAMALVAGLAASAPCRAGSYTTTVASINDTGLGADDFIALFTGTGGTISDVTVNYSSGVSATSEIIAGGAGIEVDFGTPLPSPGVLVFQFESTTGPVGLSGAFWTTTKGDAVSAGSTTIFSVDPIPEPGSMTLLGIGAMGLFTWRRLSRRKARV
jgi:hypothetical protein